MSNYSYLCSDVASIVHLPSTLILGTLFNIHSYLPLAFNTSSLFTTFAFSMATRINVCTEISWLATIESCEENLS